MLKDYEKHVAELVRTGENKAVRRAIYGERPLQYQSVASAGFDLASVLVGLTSDMRVDGPASVQWRPRFLEIAKALELLARE